LSPLPECIALMTRPARFPVSITRNVKTLFLFADFFLKASPFPFLCLLFLPMVIFTRVSRVCSPSPILSSPSFNNPRCFSRDKFFYACAVYVLRFSPEAHPTKLPLFRTLRPLPYSDIILGRRWQVSPLGRFLPASDWTLAC